MQSARRPGASKRIVPATIPFSCALNRKSSRLRSASSAVVWIKLFSCVALLNCRANGEIFARYQRHRSKQGEKRQSNKVQEATGWVLFFVKRLTSHRRLCLEEPSRYTQNKECAAACLLVEHSAQSGSGLTLEYDSVVTVREEKTKCLGRVCILPIKTKTWKCGTQCDELVNWKWRYFR